MYNFDEHDDLFQLLTDALLAARVATPGPALSKPSLLAREQTNTTRFLQLASN